MPPVHPSSHYRARALSYSESDLWQKGLLRKFGSLAWWKQRRSHLQLSGDPTPLGRFHRPAVGSDVDLRSSSDVIVAVTDPGKLEGSKLFSQPTEGSAWTSLVPSTSLDSSLAWEDGSSQEGSFSLSSSSLSHLTGPEKKIEALKLLSGQEENPTSLVPLPVWAEGALDGYFTSGASKPTRIGELENLSYSSDFGESVSEHLSGLEDSKMATEGPDMALSPKMPEVAQSSQARKAPKIRYEIRITLTKEEEEKVEDGAIEGEQTESCGEKGLLCHPGEAEALSLGVAELEKTEERCHHKPARPAPWLSVCKEFQNCTGRPRVGTCEVCGVTLSPVTVSPGGAALQRASEANPEEGKDPHEADRLSLGDGTLAERTESVASETSDNSGTHLAAESKNPRSPFEIGGGLLHAQHTMEKVTARSGQNKAGRSAASILFRWKKSAPESPKEDVKPPICKASRSHEKESARTNSPSRVSVLLEAWEKGLVGTDTSEPPKSSDNRRSRSPGHGRRLRFPKDAPHSLFPSTARGSSSPSASSADVRRSLSPPDTRRSFSSADTKQPLSPTECRKPLFPADPQPSFSPAVNKRPCFLGDSRRSLSPADTRPSFSPDESRWSRSPADTKRSPSPAGRRRSFSPASVRQSLSPASSRRFCFLTDGPGLPSSASAQNPLSSVENPHSSPTSENHGASSPVDSQYSSPSTDTRCFPSVADIRRLYSSVDSRIPSSPISSRQEFPSGESKFLRSPSNTGRSPSLADTKWPFLPAESTCSSSSVDTRRSSFRGDLTYSSSSPDAKCLSSTEDNKASSSLEESGSFSPTSPETHANSLSPQRDFAAHGPVFAQVYSPASKPKSLGKTEMQEGHSTLGSMSQKENYSFDAAKTFLAAGLQGENNLPSTEIPQEGDHSPGDINMRAEEFHRESPVPNSATIVPESLRESISHNANVPRSQTESYPSRAAHTALSYGGNYMPTATSSSPDESCVLSTMPCVVSSSTVARSQTQWYGPNGSSTVVFRSERQVIVPQAGTATIYRAGREVVMSSSGTGSVKKPQPERSLPSSCITCVPSKENWQSKGDLPEITSPKGFLSSLSEAHGYSQKLQPESFMTQTRSAEAKDAQRQRCTLEPKPAFASNGDATTVSEGVAPFRIPERDCSLLDETAFERHSSLFPASRSERNQSMPLPGGPIANGPEQDNSVSRVEKASTWGCQGIWCSPDNAEDPGICRMSTGSQEMAPSEEEDACQSELRDEQRGPRTGSSIFATESNIPFDHMIDSSQESVSQKTENRDRRAEPEPEEASDMVLFVDTLRNMEPADLRKPLKLLPRPPRPSALAKHTPLPPIHEDHVAPKSQISLPASLGELFTLTEERHLEEVPKKEDEAVAEEDLEEIENPYPSKEDTQEDKNQAGKTYPWENNTFKTEEEFGSFLGKLQKSFEDPEPRGVAPKAIANQTNMIRANILKGMSILSSFSERKAVEENKPYSRLDNSLLYSRFISPEKAQLKDPAKGKEVRSSLIPLNPAGVKIKREGQASPNGPQTYERLSCESLPSGRPDPSSRLPGASRNSKGMTALVKEAKTASRSEVQFWEENKILKKVNVRPGKIILYSESGFGGQKRDIWGDVTDATSWLLSHTISIQVVRGGWVMYEKPRFHGRKCVLAEGDVEISNPWRIYDKEGEGAENAPFCIGSLRRVVCDYRIPEISLFSEENGEGTKQRFTDSSEDTQIHGQPLKAASIIVHSGLWLLYSKPFFDDDPYVLEPGGYPNRHAWGAKDPSICSMHPIKLGSPVVENPGEPKALIYERPHFQGCSWEVSRDIYDLKKPENNQHSKMLRAGSLRIMGGCWVGYEKEGFRGHQYLLEEGEYYDWTQWGGYDEELVSLRLIRTDFLDPALVLFEAMDFEDGPSIELSEALPDVELASYGTTTQSIHVLSGVWVAYEGRNFTGEQYILEKGVYRNCEDWGASDCQISSVQPILQVGEHSLHFVSKIQLFSDPDFLGHQVSFEEDQESLPEYFIPRSCRVNGGSWILYDGQQFEGEQHVLSEGEYPTLTSMGCLFTTAICSLKKVPIFFSEPSIFLHGLECFEGKEIELNGEVRSLQAEGFNNHVLSIRVKGGIWVLCEHSDFRGRQWLLECMEITNWLTYSGLQHIGSLYPIRQKRIYFRIKNVELKSFLSVPDDVEDMKAGRVLVSEPSDKSSSIWYYEEGLLKNQVAPYMSLQVIGPAGKGCKVVLWSESRLPRQTWRMDSFGRICSQMFEDRILDVKGGTSYDRDHAILWDSSEERPTQIWDFQVL
ncbi:beta/gamma crystallin domain-containing protein 2 [Pogona vitticeps]